MVNVNQLSDFFKLALQNIGQRKMRSWLTMIGIFIGIAAVVALISLGQGLNATIQQQFENLGSDKIIVSPAGAIFGAGGVNSLVDDDVQIIKKVRGIDNAVGYMFSTGKIEWGKELGYYIITGFPTDMASYDLFSEGDYQLAKGRYFRSGERFKAIIGDDYTSYEGFKKHVGVGDKLLINDQEFDVIGVWEHIGNPMDDRSVMIPIDTAREVLGVPERIDSIFAKVKENEDPAVVALRIEESLRKDHGLKEGDEDFSVQTMMELIQSFFVILNIVTTVLVGIAAISLLVGGIGIMNTMYTAVLERTREIGIMKAIGGRNSDVLLLFLLESGLLGTAGGIIGILVGAGLSTAAAYIARTSGGFELYASFPWFLILGALLFSFLVGILSGILPAKKASQKNPVDALRYE